MRSVYSMTTVLMATKTVVKGTKTVVVAGKPRNRFEIYGKYPDFFYYRRFSGSSGFPQYPVFLLSDYKKTSFFHFLPTTFFQSLPIPVKSRQKVKSKRSGILPEIEYGPIWGYCHFIIYESITEIDVQSLSHHVSLSGKVKLTFANIRNILPDPLSVYK